jgi:general secretion pathway protein E
MFGKKRDEVADLIDTTIADRGRDSDDKKLDLVWAAEDQMRFGLMLIAEGHCSRDQVQAAIWESTVTDASLGNTLVSQGVIRQKNLMSLMEKFDSAQISTALQYNVPVDDVGFLHQEKVALFGMSATTLYLSCLGNQRKVARHFQKEFPDKTLEFLAVKPQLIDSFLQRTDKLPSKTEEHTVDASDPNARIEIVRYIPERTSDSDVVDMLVNLAGIRGGSDIHIEPKARSYTVLLRINRLRRIIHEGPLSQYNALRAQIKDRARMDQMEFRKPQDGAYSQEIMGRMFDLRVATFPLNAGQEKIVIRLLDPDKAARHLTDLGITETGDWRAACGYPHGLVIVAGKTNSGKSTTLISSLREQDRIGKSIYTIEDPIEHRVDFITQMAVNRADSVRLDFKAATRAMMRGDPEIILVGETRDAETAQAAVAAAESGHLVFSTLHAGTVRESVSRLKSFGIDDATLRPMLRGVLAQRLIRTLCGFCRGKGCGPCMMTGYDNMTVVSEMGFLPSEAHFRRMVDDDEVFWKPMVRDALHKLESGVTDEREVYRVFRSEIDYLSTDYEGVTELADRVKAVVHGGQQSMVDMTPTRRMTHKDEELDGVAVVLEKKLAEHSVNKVAPVDPAYDDAGAADLYGG